MLSFAANFTVNLKSIKRKTKRKEIILLSCFLLLVLNANYFGTNTRLKEIIQPNYPEMKGGLKS